MNGEDSMSKKVEESQNDKKKVGRAERKRGRIHGDASEEFTMRTLSRERNIVARMEQNTSIIRLRQSTINNNYRDQKGIGE